MKEIVRYQIEARHPVTGYWKVLRKCVCPYEREYITHSFLWYTWYTARITNRHEAELRCRKEVMICRRGYEKDQEELRVVVVTLKNENILDSVVWENGEWKDC